MSLKNITGERWLLLRVQSGTEDKIQKIIDDGLKELKESVDEAIHLNQEVDHEDVKVCESLDSVLVPKIVDNHIKNGEVKSKNTTAFPGYLLVKIKLQNNGVGVSEQDNGANNLIKKDKNQSKDETGSENIIKSIASFLRRTIGRNSIIGSKNGGDFALLSSSEVDAMMKKIEETSEKRKSSVQIGIGSLVRVINGPFSSTEAKVTEFDYEAGSLKVSFNLFGHLMTEECKIEDVQLIAYAQ